MVASLELTGIESMSQFYKFRLSDRPNLRAGPVPTQNQVFVQCARPALRTKDLSEARSPYKKRKKITK